MEEDQKMSPHQIQAALMHFHGSEGFYRLHPNLIMTEGAKFVADQCESYWLMDCIASYQGIERVAVEEFQVIDLTVDLEQQSGRIVVSDGNENVVHIQDLMYTSFPLASIRLYYTDGVVLLPQEY